MLSLSPSKSTISFQHHQLQSQHFHHQLTMIPWFEIQRPWCKPARPPVASQQTTRLNRGNQSGATSAYVVPRQRLDTHQPHESRDSFISHVNRTGVTQKDQIWKRFFNGSFLKMLLKKPKYKKNPSSVITFSINQGGPHLIYSFTAHLSIQPSPWGARSRLAIYHAMGKSCARGGTAHSRSSSGSAVPRAAAADPNSNIV
jgi:hypothetical protein